MKHIQLIAGLIFLVVVTVFFMDRMSEQKKTPQPGKFLEALLAKHPYPKKVLIVLDVDDTTLAPPPGQLLGRSEMYAHLLARAVKERPEAKRTELAESIDPLLEMIYDKIAVAPTDETLPSVLDRLKADGIRVIGISSRGKRMTRVTLRQLESAGIHFSDTGPEKIIFMPDDRMVSLVEGVVIVSHENRKDEALVELLKQKVLKKPAQIIMIDAHESQLREVAKTLRKEYKNKIRFHPVVCTYSKTQPRFNNRASEEELIEFLHGWRRDPDVFDYILKDPYTQKIISQCGRLFGENREHCMALRRLRIMEQPPYELPFAMWPDSAE